MTRLISMTTGRRPKTAQLALDSWTIQDPSIFSDLTVVIWDDRCGAPRMPGPSRLMHLPGANRGAGHNEALRDFVRREGDLPDWWLILDDDVIPCWRLYERMQAVLEADKDIWELGAWNDGAIRTTSGQFMGQRRLIAGEVVNVTDGEFNVGGAVTMIPKRTLMKVGSYDPDAAWLEDSDYSQRIWKAGGLVAVARTIYAVLLQDDGVDPTYRTDSTEAYKESYRRRLGDDAFIKRWGT